MNIYRIPTRHGMCRSKQGSEFLDLLAFVVFCFVVLLALAVR